MRNGLGDFALREAVVHSDRDMARELRNLPVRDQRADGGQAPVARGEIGSQPQLTKQHIGRVLRDAGEKRAELITHALRAIGFGRLVKRKHWT